jgi:serine/threonine protein kinase
MIRKENIDSKLAIEKESTILRKLDSPYIVKFIRDFVYNDEIFCFLMEYCEV